MLEEEWKVVSVEKEAGTSSVVCSLMDLFLNIIWGDYGHQTDILQELYVTTNFCQSTRLCMW